MICVNLGEGRRLVDLWNRLNPRTESQIVCRFLIRSAPCHQTPDHRPQRQHRNRRIPTIDHTSPTAKEPNQWTSSGITRRFRIRGTITTPGALPPTMPIIQEPLNSGNPPARQTPGIEPPTTVQPKPTDQIGNHILTSGPVRSRSPDDRNTASAITRSLATRACRRRGGLRR